MKISPARADDFINTLGDDTRAILLYGPDSGLIRERARFAILKITNVVNDPFLISELTPPELRNDPARLADEALALPFGGGRRAVHLKNAVDGLSTIITETVNRLSECPAPAPSLLIVEAAELSPRSSLRRLFEGNESCAAIACYLDEGAGLERVITDALRDHGLKLDGDARSWLAGHLGTDRQLPRRELEKLALYCAGKLDVTLEDCLAVVGSGGSSDIDEAIYAAASGDLGALDQALARASQEGQSPIAILRAAQRHFQRLHLVCSQAHKGSDIGSAMKSLRPPVFFKLADRFRAQTRTWTLPRLTAALGLLTDAEIRCKSTGQPAHLISARVLMQIANAARHGQRS